MNKLLKALLLVLLLSGFYSQQVLACVSCSGGGPLYKGYPMAQASGFFAKQFDKVAPKPGMDWDGEPNTWIAGAVTNGWVIKTSPQDAKPGALIFGFTQNKDVWVGIVQEVNGGEIKFDTLDTKGRVLHNSATPESIKAEFNLIGYIWPERTTNT